MEPAVIGDTRVSSHGRADEGLRLSGADGKRFRNESELYVATPPVLRYLGIDPATVDPGTDFLVDRSVADRRPRHPEHEEPQGVRRHERPEDRDRTTPLRLGSGGRPPYFITLNGLRRHGWRQIPAGWLVESSRPLTSDQIADARQAAADAGLTVEVNGGRILLREDDGHRDCRGRAPGARHPRDDRRTDPQRERRRPPHPDRDRSDLRHPPNADGHRPPAHSPSSARSSASPAPTSCSWRLYYDDLGYLSDVPVLYLALAVVGVPLAATAAGWLLAGREPPAIARRAIE